MSKKVPETSTLLYATFVGLNVDIIVRSVKAKMGNMMTNMAICGFLLDECEEFYYVGENANEVSTAVRKNEVVTVSLSSGELSRFESELNNSGEVQ
jgi:hypothetical protein